MKENDRLFIAIIKSALTGTVVQKEEQFDYENLFKLSKAHKVVPLVLQGLHNMVGNFPQKEEFYSYTIQLMHHDRNQLYWLNKIQSIFAQNDIDYMLLKGSSIKNLYPASEFRLMGDIDILIKEMQYPEIKALLSCEGLIEGKETDHELIWKSKNGVLIELHKRLIPSYNDDYYAYYADSWAKAVQKQGNCYSMIAEDEYIYMFTHLTKHYRDGGIGVRHIIDIWIFTVNHPELNWQYIESELDALGLKLFHQRITETIQVWFNNEKDTELTDYVTERIVESGAYGIKEKCDAANAARLSARTTTVSQARRRKLVRLVFMPYSEMKLKYPVLKRAPFLLPLMWVVRWIDAIVNKRNNISRQVERLNCINTNTVSDFTKELEKVGLRFDLKKDK